MNHRNQLRKLAAAVAIVATVLVPAPAHAADPSAEVPANGDEPGAQLERSVLEAGGLGLYFDAKASRYVAVFPAGRLAAASAVDGHGLPFVAKGIAVAKAKVDALASELTDKARGLPKGTGFGFWFDPETGVTVVETSAPVDYFADLTAAYPDLLELRLVDKAERLSRDADPSPHRGGATIWNAARTKFCTSGFTVKKSNGTKYLATAGHCFGLGTTVEGDNGAAFGSVQWRAPFPTLDTELIGGATYTGSIYTGGAAGTSTKVAGAGDGTIGSTYCTSGTVSTEQCNKVLQSNSATYCDESVCIGNLARFSNGDQLIGGDSGGPFYLKFANGTVSARGTIVAKAGTSGYATKWSTISSQFSVSIVLG